MRESDLEFDLESEKEADSPDTQLRMSFLEPKDFKTAPGFVVFFHLNNNFDKQSYVQVRTEIYGWNQIWEQTYNITGMLGHPLEHELVQGVIDFLIQMLEMNYAGVPVNYDLVLNNLKKIGTIPGVTE